MGRIHTEVSPLQQGGHLLRGQPPAVDGDAGPFALFLGPQRGGHADQYLGPSAASCFENTRPSVVPLNTTALMRGTPAA